MTCIVHLKISLSKIALACVNKLTDYQYCPNLLSHLRSRGQWGGGRWSLSIKSRNRLCMILVRVLFVVTSLRFFFVPIFANCNIMIRFENFHGASVLFTGPLSLSLVCNYLHNMIVQKSALCAKDAFPLQFDLNICIGVNHNCNYEQLYIKATQ